MFNYLKNTKFLTLLGMFIAIKIVMSSLYIPVSDNLRIYFSFLITALECSIFGPAIALISGFVTDIVGFYLFPSGQFFFGYTLSSMLSHLIYALWLYNRSITVVKLAFAKACVNLFVNILLGSLWSHIMFGKAYFYYLARSVIKNISLLPFEIILLVLFFNIVLPILIKKKIICHSHIPLKIK